MENNKLVRDNIPELIALDGKRVTFHAITSNSDFKMALKNKLVEEAMEFSNAMSNKDILEELADVLEVIDTIQRVFDIKPSALSDLAHNKRIKRGGFDKGYVIDCVEGDS